MGDLRRLWRFGISANQLCVFKGAFGELESSRRLFEVKELLKIPTKLNKRYEKHLHVDMCGAFYWNSL